MKEILSEFVNKHPDPILGFTFSGLFPNPKISPYFYVNDAACDFFGYSRNELLKMKPNKLEARIKTGTIKSMLQKIYFENTYYKSTLLRENGHEINVIITAKSIKSKKNNIVFQQITLIHQIKSFLGANCNRILELENEIKGKDILKGFLVVCLECRKVKTEKGNWIPFDVYFSDNSQMHFSHGICPNCKPEYLNKFKKGL